jgi:hypothetical protein
MEEWRKHMRKKIVLFVSSLMLIACLTGCPYVVSAEHTRQHEKVMSKKFTEIHKFIDKHFWLYDWEDPYAY